MRLFLPWLRTIVKPGQGRTYVRRIYIADVNSQNGPELSFAFYVEVRQKSLMDLRSGKIITEGKIGLYLSKGAFNSFS